MESPVGFVPFFFSRRAYEYDTWSLFSSAIHCDRNSGMLTSSSEVCGSGTDTGAVAVALCATPLRGRQYHVKKISLINVAEFTLLEHSPIGQCFFTSKNNFSSYV